MNNCRVKFSDILNVIPGEIVAKGRNFASVDILQAVVSDMMSEVLTTDKDDILLLTQLSSAQVVRTADSVGAIGIIVVNGTPIQAGVKELAEDLGLTILRTTLPGFEACVALGKLLNK